ncbi:OmpA family protein [Pseudooceanicola sp.]|uniref:OmpA family protein n=1 Tax=Pseudooceanicola sp. TaxID=1914328 RepID=UPI0035C666DC
MTSTFLKSTTAIVLSLSLAVPTIPMAQTAAELEAALGVDTTGMTEAELEALRQQLAEEQAQAEAEAAAEAEANAANDTAAASDEATEQAQTAEEEESLIDRAVGAVTEGVEALTGDDEAEATAEAEAEAAPEAQAATEEPAATEDPAADAASETTAEAAADTNTEAEADATADADATANAEGEADTTAQAADEPAATDTPETAPETTADATTDSEATATAEAGGSANATTDAEASTDATADAQTDETPTEPTEEQNPVAEAVDEGQQQLQAEVDELKTQLDALTNESAEEQATRQAATEAEAAQEQATSMAATADADAEAAEVIEQTVTEETARSSSEEFETSATAAAPAAEAEDNRSGLDTIGKIALFGLGALAVGQILNNGSEVVSNSGDRVVVQQPDGSYRVYKNDDVLMFQPGTDVKTYAYDDGSTRTVATREDGTQIETVRAADGTVLRRTRILANGNRVVLFDDTQVAQQVEVNQLPQTDRADRSINFQQAQEEELRAALQARLPQEIDRRFSLSQVRNITAVRDLVPEIDVDNINFETGSATIRPDEAEELAQLGTLMRQTIEENPGEVFLIEGHTDAVGAASYNLALSDRRAESVALALTEFFDVPPENMVVQGYGESDLKIRTAGAERENRRASVRRITPLLTGS